MSFKISFSIIFDIESWTFSLIGRYWTGQPYTPQFTAATIASAGGINAGLPDNSARLPNQRALDLTINKNFGLIEDLSLRLFINVYNLLDIRDETAVYQDTGTAEYTSNTDPKDISYSPRRVSTIEDYVNQPSWYTAPRQIQVGVTIGF